MWHDGKQMTRTQNNDHDIFSSFLLAAASSFNIYPAEEEADLQQAYHGEHHRVAQRCGLSGPPLARELPQERQQQQTTTKTKTGKVRPAQNGRVRGRGGRGKGGAGRTISSEQKTKTQVSMVSRRKNHTRYLPGILTSKKTPPKR